MSGEVQMDGSASAVVVQAPVAKRHSLLAATLREAWRFGRTKAGLVLTFLIVLIAIAGPWVTPHSPTEILAMPYASPSSGLPLGADYLGHDVLSRVLCGGRTVIGLALVATVIGVGLGATLGLVAGYARRSIDETVMRLLDVILAFPQLVLVLVFVAIVGPKLWLIVLLTGVSHAPRVARTARAATLDVAQRDFVHSAEALGVSRTKIIFSEILPNISSPLLVEFGLRLTYSIALIAGLSFMGFGMQPPAADWGLMINENRLGIIVQPWAVAVPVLLIAILTIGTNFMADGLDRVLTGIERDTSGA